MECCLDVLWLFYYEMEDCNYCLVDEKVRERRIGSVRGRGSEGEIGDWMGFELGLWERGGDGENNKKFVKEWIFYWINV